MWKLHNWRLYLFDNLSLFWYYNINGWAPTVLLIYFYKKTEGYQKYSSVILLFSWFYPIAFQVIYDLLIIEDTEVVTARKVLVVMPELVAQDTRELLFEPLVADVAVDARDRAVVKHYGVAKVIAYVLTHYE